MNFVELGGGEPGLGIGWWEGNQVFIQPNPRADQISLGYFFLVAKQALKIFNIAFDGGPLLMLAQLAFARSVCLSRAAPRLASLTPKDGFKGTGRCCNKFSGGLAIPMT